MTKPIETMSSEELFELAEFRRIEEEKDARQTLKSELEELRKERRELINQHKKTLSQVEDRIEKIRASLSSTPGASNRLSRSSGTNISAVVLSTLETHKKMSTKELQAELNSNGVVAANLSQTLAYLKRQGKIISPERAVYAIV